METSLLIGLALFTIAILYSAVGHAGASGYLAVLTLAALSPDEIKPISLVLNIAVASVATVRFVKAGYFRRDLFLWFAAGSVPASFIGGYIQLSDLWFRYLASVFLLFSAMYMLYRRFARNNPGDINHRIIPSHLVISSGAAIGFCSGLIGVGGGIFLSPILFLLKAAPLRTISGISAAFILVNSTVGLAGHLSKMKYLPDMTLWWVSLVIAGGALGSWLGTKIISNKGIYLLLSLVLLFAGIKMML